MHLYLRKLYFRITVLTGQYDSSLKRYLSSRLVMLTASSVLKLKIDGTVPRISFNFPLGVFRRSLQVKWRKQTLAAKRFAGFHIFPEAFDSCLRTAVIHLLNNVFSFGNTNPPRPLHRGTTHPPGIFPNKKSILLNHMIQCDILKGFTWNWYSNPCSTSIERLKIEVESKRPPIHGAISALFTFVWLQTQFVYIFTQPR